VQVLATVCAVPEAEIWRRFASSSSRTRAFDFWRKPLFDMWEPCTKIGGRMDNTINVCIPPCRLQKIVSYAYNFWCYYKQLFGLRNLWRLVPNALTSCLTFHISGNVSPRRRNIQRTAVKCWILRSLLCYSKRTFPYRFMPCRFGDSLCSTRSRNMASFIVSQIICAWRWMF